MRRFAGALLGVAAVMGAPQDALAFDNDFNLSKLGPPETLQTRDGSEVRLIEADPLAQERFARFASELALAIAPLPAGLMSTVGDGAFDLSISGDFAFIQGSQVFSGGTTSHVWPTEKPPPGALFLPTLHMRKGLPFSLEIGADFGYLAFSSMVATTASVKWALVEGFQWWPDIGVRAFATALIGSGPMTLVVGGWDVGGSYRFPLWGGAEAGVYGGYQHIGMDATTTHIDFAPDYEDERDPMSDKSVFKQLSFGPLYHPATRFSRVYFGAQVRSGMMVLGVDAATASGTNKIADDETSTYSVAVWRLGLRAGVHF